MRDEERVEFILFESRSKAIEAARVIHERSVARGSSESGSQFSVLSH